MLLTDEKFHEKACEIANAPGGEIGIDFETTGLRVYGKDRAGIVGFTDVHGGTFCNYLRGVSATESLRVLCANPNLTYCAHNAKFELAILHGLGIEVKGPLWDTEVNARIERNNHMKYDLDSCGERAGLGGKFEPMAAFLAKRGNKGAHLQAPPEVLEPYVERDAWLSYALRRHQVAVFKHWDASSQSKIRPVVKLEQAVLPWLFQMEQRGLLCDVQYCREAYEYEKQQIETAKRRFLELTGAAFVDSGKALAPLFDAHGICYGRTDKGNPSFTEDALASVQSNPVVAAVLAHRRALKRANTYWLNLLELEENGIVHPSINQNRAQTGRMSISDPSCQNWPTDEEEWVQDLYPLRRAFIARPGCLIASLDHAQMELRKGADEAEDTSIIARIRSGADLHQEIADIAEVPRGLAKNGRFAKQYGAGVPKIATTLGVTEAVARTISEAIDEQAKAMTAYSRYLSRHARPYSTDWLGRRFFWGYGHEYKAFNYRIQGGCAEILKIAIVNIGEFLSKYGHPNTYMILPVHDEIVLNMDPRDLSLLSEIKRLMIEAHKDKKLLEMDVSIHTGENFHDLEKWTA